MPFISFVIQAFYAAFCLYALRDKEFSGIAPGPSESRVPKEKIALNMTTFFVLSFALRAYFLLTQTNGDLKYYVSAMRSLLDNGFFGYYDHAKIVYPPLFNYTYCLLGQLLRLFGIPLTDTLQLPLFFLKLPATVCDYLTALFLYRIGARRDYRLGFALCCLYILSPAAIFDSAYVGQVDGIYTLFVVLTVWCVSRRRSDIGCFFFVISFLFKYQTVFVFPVLLCGLLHEVFFTDFSWKKFRHYLCFGCLSVAMAFASYLPFICDLKGKRFAPELMFGTVQASVTGYARCSTNAYNLWTLLGCNLKPTDSPYLFLNAGTWGTIHIVLLTCGSFALFIRMCRRQRAYDGFRGKNKTPESCDAPSAKITPASAPLLGAWLITGVFCFSVNMMCRYLFPAIALLFLACAMHPTKRIRRCVCIFSVLYIPVIMLPLTCYGYEQYYDYLILPRVLSAGMIGGFFYLSYVIWRECDGKP